MNQANPSPGPWVDPEHQYGSAWTATRGPVKFLEFPVRIPEMSHRAFHLYWQRHHSPHVMNATGFSQFMRKYSTAHVFPEPSAGLPPHYTQNTSFEGAAEVWLSGLEEVGKWLSHPIYAELIQPDEPRFIRQDGSVEVVITREEKVLPIDRDKAETGLVKVLAIYARRDGMGRSEFHERVSALARDLVARGPLGPKLVALTVSHRIVDPYPEWMPSTTIDAVAEFWFRSRTEVAAVFSDPKCAGGLGAAERNWLRNGQARALVTRVHVVHDEYSFQPTLMQPHSLCWDD
jgi:hypothetical protein